MRTWKLLTFLVVETFARSLADSLYMGIICHLDDFRLHLDFFGLGGFVLGALACRSTPASRLVVPVESFLRLNVDSCLSILPVIIVLSVLLQELNHSCLSLAFVYLVLLVECERLVRHRLQAAKADAIRKPRNRVTVFIYILTIDLLVNLLCAFVVRVIDLSQHLLKTLSSPRRISHDFGTRVAQSRTASFWLVTLPSSRP